MCARQSDLNSLVTVLPFPDVVTVYVQKRNDQNQDTGQAWE